MLGISDIRAPHIGVSLDLNLISEDKRSCYTEEEKAIVVFILCDYVPLLGTHYVVQYKHWWLEEARGRETRFWNNSSLPNPRVCLELNQWAAVPVLSDFS